MRVIVFTIACWLHWRWPYQSRNSRDMARRATTHLAFFIPYRPGTRSEEHTSELQSRLHLVCRLLLEKKKFRLSIYSQAYFSRNKTLATSALLLRHNSPARIMAFWQPLVYQEPSLFINRNGIQIVPCM